MMNLGVASGVTPLGLASPRGLRVRVVTGAVAAIVLASFANAVTVTGALVADDAGATPKLYHAGLALAGGLLALRGRIVRPRTELLVYFAVTVAATLLAYLVLEPRVAGVKLLVALAVALVGTELGRVAGRASVLRACRIASVAFLVLVTVKNVQHVPAFIAYLANPFGHPEVPTLAGGGLNLEATCSPCRRRSSSARCCSCRSRWRRRQRARSTRVGRASWSWASRPALRWCTRGAGGGCRVRSRVPRLPSNHACTRAGRAGCSAEPSSSS